MSFAVHAVCLFDNAEFTVIPGGISQMVKEVAQGIGFGISGFAHPDLIHFAYGGQGVAVGIDAPFHLAAESALHIGSAIDAVLASGELLQHHGELLAHLVIRGVDEKTVGKASLTAGIFQRREQSGKAFAVFSVQTHWRDPLFPFAHTLWGGRHQSP